MKNLPPPLPRLQLVRSIAAAPPKPKYNGHLLMNAAFRLCLQETKGLRSSPRRHGLFALESLARPGNPHDGPALGPLPILQRHGRTRTLQKSLGDEESKTQPRG